MHRFHVRNVLREASERPQSFWIEIVGTCKAGSKSTSDWKRLTSYVYIVSIACEPTTSTSRAQWLFFYTHRCLRITYFRRFHSEIPSDLNLPSV